MYVKMINLISMRFKLKIFCLLLYWFYEVKVYIKIRGILVLCKCNLCSYMMKWWYSVENV